MQYWPKISIDDAKRARQMTKDVQIGNYFLFVKHNAGISHRFKRLLNKSYDKKEVLPLIDTAVTLEGVTITPTSRDLKHIGCVVTDRDLYRAEQDTVHIFIALPMASASRILILQISHNGKHFDRRRVQLSNSIGIETLDKLLPGDYSVQLLVLEEGMGEIGIPVSFTVAEYSLAPLSARLVKHNLNQKTKAFTFELSVESYQLPFADKLVVTLIDQDMAVAEITLDSVSSGFYAGELQMDGTGPFRLRLMAVDDAERVAEVVIPGSRATERQASVINELGQTRLFSMMPEPNTLPIRGGYLTEGDFIAAPLTVEKIVTDQRLIQVNTKIESVALINLDLLSGKHKVQNVGDVMAGNTVTVATDSPMMTVFIGGFVNGEPFEGYTTFIQPDQLQLTVTTPKTIRPKDNLTVQLNCTSPAKYY
ncbi:hypothetical protein TI05_12990 [Achromatium sp. WMS3]|nr:hypothetical protein TI05_12990 [Achromatium sp. WMS3]